MRLTRQHRRPGLPELGMAPMIDVVFLLLIFFMCTASWKLLENQMPSQLPRAGLGDQSQQDDFDPIRVRLSRSATGVLVECDGQACGTFDGLVERLRARSRIVQLPVLIEGEPTVPFGHMVAALDACYRADLRSVAFSAKGVSP